MGVYAADVLLRLLPSICQHSYITTVSEAYIFISITHLCPLAKLQVRLFIIFCYLIERIMYGVLLTIKRLYKYNLIPFLGTYAPPNYTIVILHFWLIIMILIWHLPHANLHYNHTSVCFYIHIGLKYAYTHTHTLVHAHKSCQCQAVTRPLLELCFQQSCHFFH